MKKKTVEIDGKKITLGASGNTPFLYMSRTGRDINKDINAIQSAVSHGDGDSIPMTMTEMEIFADLAYTMAYQGRDKNEPFPESRDEWLEDLDGVFTLYTLLPAMIELWGLNSMQTVESKKNHVRPHGR